MPHLQLIPTLLLSITNKEYTSKKIQIKICICIPFLSLHKILQKEPPSLPLIQKLRIKKVNKVKKKSN